MQNLHKRSRRFLWKRFHTYVLRYLCSALGAYAISRPVALSCMAQAYEFRGYHAVGGEWILISAIFVTACYCISKGYLYLYHKASAGKQAAGPIRVCRKIRGLR